MDGRVDVGQISDKWNVSNIEEKKKKGTRHVRTENSMSLHKNIYGVT